MKAVVGVVFAALIVGVFVVLGGGNPAPERVGYFKSDSNNRVMAYLAPEGMTGDEAREVLAGVMHTPGRLTFAVIYQPGARHPGQRLTVAPDYFTAAEILDTPPNDGWTWGAVINIKGQINYEEK